MRPATRPPATAAATRSRHSTTRATAASAQQPVPSWPDPSSHYRAGRQRTAARRFPVTRTFLLVSAQHAIGLLLGSCQRVLRALRAGDRRLHGVAHELVDAAVLVNR